MQMMKKGILFFVLAGLPVTGLLAQEPGEREVFMPSKFRPRYAGVSLNTGVMFMPGLGSAYYVAPKIGFQTAPRLFLNAGVGFMQYSPAPSPLADRSNTRPVSSVYIFSEGMYLLNEKWSLNGSVMKNITPVQAGRQTPCGMPAEAMHFGIDCKLTPNITIGAKIGYSNGNNTRISHLCY
ncbi:MAG: hypothetical protein LBR08_05885 [Bacteroidales bacterium]|jgi:hypothetical protein|nr:hypothetical protein [Bacteroidales bacterium]